MYNSKYLDPDISPQSLQRKVQFDIRFYFARCGCENMDKMKKTDFKLSFDTKTENWFVMKTRDQLTKNHRGIEEKESGIMPQNKDDKLCPVRSFNMYLEKLNPENEMLWQIPLQNINPKRARCVVQQSTLRKEHTWKIHV